jgi:hypothetical protein
MPIIIAKREGSCTACGGRIRKTEQAFYTAATGLRHPEPQCRNAANSEHRPNTRAGRCSCGTWVPAREGRLVHQGEEQRDGQWQQSWAIQCAGCAR